MRLGVQLNMCVPECFNDSALQDLSVAEDDDEGVRRHCPPQGFARGGTARKKSVRQPSQAAPVELYDWRLPPRSRPCCSEPDQVDGASAYQVSSATSQTYPHFIAKLLEFLTVAPDHREHHIGVRRPCGGLPP
ncbi:hypothetical protein PISMIDRAFT_544134 [Pisolithus microcarpus 441]|uniref:Uncharacterized protein n=1 Tax=Pisolithus microcarpus 441 TaxID=765257 RepID=A0A0C9ZNL6_9AGAM|nr:hypothetical protein PISMIDRAFT_176970 [Pisolithus microcarpus 441]KIK21388.1 hypothetical protein PISMIDRAFT_544134 [Pisolithus microcarpus 441]